MATINYENKEAISVNPTIPNKNKVVDSDMNLIKQVGNQILTTMGVYTDDWDKEGTYLIDDIVIYDNRIFKNLTGTNTTTPPTEDTTNWLEVSLRDISGGAEIPIQDTAPQNPEEDDLWIDTTNDNRLKYFNGTSWVGVSDNITGDTLPIGAIVPFGGWDAPTGWLICDGTLLNKTTYPELFDAIGYSFGGEEGGATFGLPDLRGRVPVGEKDNDSDFDGMGVTGGEKSVLLTLNNLPTPYRSLKFTSAESWGVSEGNGAHYIFEDNGGQAHNNLQPYQTVNYIIKAKQSAGVVAQVETSVSNSNTNVYSCKYVNDTLSNLIKIKEVAGTTDGNGFLNLNMNLNQYIVLGVRVKIGQDSFANPYNIRGIDGWSVQLKTWDGQNIGSTQFTLEVVYIET